MSSRRMPGLGHGLVGRGGVSVVAAVVLLAGFAPVSWADEEEPSPSPVTSVEVPPPSDDPPAPSEPAEPASTEPTPSPSPAPVVSEPAVAEPEVGFGTSVSGEPSDVPGSVGPVGPVAPSPEPEPASGTGRGSVSVSGGGGVVPAALSAVLTLNGSSAVNRIVDVGTTRSGFGVEVSGGSADSVTWSVDDPSVLSVAFEGSSARVTGVSEGVTRLRVRVRDGSASAEDWAWITVQTDVADTPGAVALEGAGLYPSATTDSDRWLVLSSNVTATVLAVSDKWVRLQFRDGVVGSSDDTAWASKYVVDIPPTSVAVSPATATVEAGRTVGLSGSFLQSYANDVTLAWSSSPTSVATVSTGGVVTGVSPGTATVTLTGSSSHGVRVTATARITVTAATVRVTGVTLDKTTATLTTGSTLTLTATVTPSNATNKTVTWSSSNTAVATVTPTGTVTGKTGGTATITVTTIDGGKTATATITVTVPVTGVRLNKTSARAVAGSTVALVATVVPSTATNKAVTWKSSNDKVATVSSTGLVTTRAGVSATITVTTSDGGKKATAVITVIVPVTGVTVSPASVKVPVGKTATLKATVHPSTATNRAVTWSSSKTAVVTVAPTTGVVTARKVGTATITARTSDGGRTSSATVTVFVPVTGVTVSPTSTKLAVGKNTTLKARVAPTNATDQRVTWKSSNDKIAHVTSVGKVTGKKAGTVTVTVRTVEGGKTATAKVTVVVPVTGVSVSPTSAKLAVGRKITLKEKVKPSNATDKRVTWKTSSSKIASVDAGGRVTGKKAGKATITVKATDGAKTAKSSITVVVPVTGVTVIPATKTLECCTTTINAKAHVKPTNATNKKITWKSSNSKVAAVDRKGRITPKKRGKATITATTEDGHKTDTLDVQVATTITYKANGGSGAPAKDIWTTSGTITISPTRPTRPGYTFAGWATNAAATKVKYTTRELYNAHHSATLYAVWHINYVALGDSYSSGEGALRHSDESQFMTSGAPRACHRSPFAYSQVLRRDPHLRMKTSDADFRACSGATTADIRGGTQRQANYVDPTATGLVTMTIGGNDIHFADIIKKCLVFKCRRNSGTVTNALEDIKKEAAKFGDTYRQILKGKKDVRLLVIGYPFVGPRRDTTGEFAPMCGALAGAISTMGDRRSISEGVYALVDQLNFNIRLQVDAVAKEFPGRIEYASPLEAGDPFKGHDICSNTGGLMSDDREYINGVILSPLSKIVYSLHPNDKGQGAYAHIVRTYLVDIKKWVRWA